MQTLTLPASLDSLSAIRRFLAELSAGIGRDDHAIYGLQLAVDEIATNAITHGEAGQRDPATFTLRAEKKPDALTVTLEDYGGRFDPRTALHHPPPGGWGVRLALEGVDRFDYQWDGERNRNIFVLNRFRPLVVDLSGEGRTLASRLGELGYEAAVVPGDTTSPPDPTTYDLVIFCPSPDQPLSAAMVKRFKGGSKKTVSALVSVAEAPGAEAYLALGADDVLPKSLPTSLLAVRLRLFLDRKHLRELCSVYVRRLHQAERLNDDLKNVVLPLGPALSGEKDFERLLERILVAAQTICNADGGLLYLRTPDDYLTFSIVRSETLNLAMGGTSGNKITYPMLRMFDPQTAKPNLKNIVVYVAHQGRTVNIPDTYSAADFDFSEKRQFDEVHNYRTQSLLTIPIKHGTGYALGVLQLVNARDPEVGMTIPFDTYLQEVVECLALQASVALNNHLQARGDTVLGTYRVPPTP